MGILRVKEVKQFAQRTHNQSLGGVGRAELGSGLFITGFHTSNHWARLREMLEGAPSPDPEGRSEGQSTHPSTHEAHAPSSSSWSQVKTVSSWV